MGTSYGPSVSTDVTWTKMINGALILIFNMINWYYLYRYVKFLDELHFAYSRDIRKKFLIRRLSSRKASEETVEIIFPSIDMPIKEVLL